MGNRETDQQHWVLRAASLGQASRKLKSGIPCLALLFWYKQQGGQVTLVILQEAYKQYNATLNRFSVNFQKAAKSFSLEISDSQLGDAATYFCALMERHGDTGNREGLTETSDLSICAE